MFKMGIMEDRYYSILPETGGFTIYLHYRRAYPKKAWMGEKPEYKNYREYVQHKRLRSEAEKEVDWLSNS